MLAVSLLLRPSPARRERGAQHYRAFRIASIRSFVSG